MNKIKAFAALGIAAGLGLAATAYADGGASDIQLAKMQRQVNALQNQVNSMGAVSKDGKSIGNMVSFNTPSTVALMGVQNWTGGAAYLLNARKNHQLANRTLYVGGLIRANVNMQRVGEKNYSTIAPKNVTRKTYSSILLPQVDIDFIANINPWVTAYIQINGNPYEGSMTNGKTGDDAVEPIMYNGSLSADAAILTIHQAFVLVGDLNKYPVYGFIGKKRIDFGSFETLSFNSTPLTRRFFAALGNTAGLGYQAAGFNIVASAINGTTGGSLLAGLNLNTTNSSQINNFAVNADFSHKNGGLSWKVGLGYLNGSNARFARTTDRRNGAWDMNAELGFGGFTILGEYVQTAKKTNSTYGTKRVKSWDLEANYKFPLLGADSRVNIGYSEIRAIETRKARTLVVGLDNQTFKNVWLGVEYSHTRDQGMVFASTTDQKVNFSTVAFVVTAAI